MSSLAEGTARNLDEVNEVTDECTYETEFESMVARNNNPVTLLNFDPTCNTKKFLTSPRSIKACIMKGVEEWELLCKTKEELADEVIPAKFQAHREEFLELKANFYEKSRQSRLQSCITARNKLIQQEQNSIVRTENSPLKIKERSYSGMKLSPPQKVFDSGRKHFQAMQRKQMQEIDNIIHDSKLQEAINLKQEYNQAKKEKMKEAQKILVSFRERENAEAKIRREQKKKEVSEERDRSLKSRKNHEVCFHTKEESETAKQAENAIMELLWEMTGQVDSSKGQFVDSKEILNQRISGIVEAEEKKKELFQNKLIEKMLKNEERKKQIENERMISMEYRRLSAGIKQENVAKAQMLKDQAATEREIKYHNKLHHNDKAKQRIDKERSIERQLRSLQESQRSEQVRYRAKIEEMEKELKNQYLFQEITADHHRAQKQRKEVLDSKREQHMLGYLKEEEARQNFLRKGKSDKYQREQVEEKIQIHSERVSSRSREREQVRKETSVALRKVSQSRQEIQEEYKKVKQKVEKSLYAQNLTNRSHLTNRSINGSPSNSFSRLRTDSPLRILTQTRSSPESRHEYAFTEFSPHKIRTPTTMTEPTTASTPIKSSRAPSICHNRTNSMVGSVVSYEVILEEESHNMMSMTPSAPQTTANKPERRSRAQRGSMPVVKVNGIETKSTNNTRVNSRETSKDKREIAKPQMVEDKPFAGKMNKTNLARKIETKELLLLLEREINMGSDNEEDFKKSAQKILKTIKSHDKQMTELKRQIDYLEIPWSTLK